jgi:hypothetical protein
MASSVVVTTGFSIGYVLWLARGGALLASLASAHPGLDIRRPAARAVELQGAAARAPG